MKTNFELSINLFSFRFNNNNENGRKRNNLNENYSRTMSIWLEMYNKHDTQFNLLKKLKAARCVSLRSSNEIGIQWPTNETTMNEQIIIIN